MQAQARIKQGLVRARHARACLSNKASHPFFPADNLASVTKQRLQEAGQIWSWLTEIVNGQVYAHMHVQQVLSMYNAGCMLASNRQGGCRHMLRTLLPTALTRHLSVLKFGMHLHSDKIQPQLRLCFAAPTTGHDYLHVPPISVIGYNESLLPPDGRAASMEGFRPATGLGDLVTPLFRSENIDWGKSLRVCIMYWARKASDPALQ
eukprot:scaffold39796_cov23-Tisochrysis_lutea.AAC.1